MILNKFLNTLQETDIMVKVDPSLYYPDPNEEIIIRTYSKEDVELMKIEYEQLLNKVKTENQHLLNEVKTQKNENETETSSTILEKEAENVKENCQIEKKINKEKA